jgi:hypothetical protein
LKFGKKSNSTASQEEFREMYLNSSNKVLYIEDIKNTSWQQNVWFSFFKASSLLPNKVGDNSFPLSGEKLVRSGNICHPACTEDCKLLTNAVLGDLPRGISKWWEICQEAFLPEQHLQKTGHTYPSKIKGKSTLCPSKSRTH